MPPGATVHTADTGDLDQVQKTVIAQGRFTEQHAKPCMSLIETFRLRKGERQLDIPKYGEMVAHDIIPGIELTEGEDVNPAIVSATVNRIALKVILLDDLVDQMSQDTFRIVGHMAGDALGTKEDKDVIAKFSGFSNGLGADNKFLTLQNASNCVAWSQAGDTDADGRRFGSLRGINFVHHPNAIGYLRETMARTAATYPVPSLRNWDVLKDFWAGFQISGVQFWHDGNILKISSVDSAYGALFHRTALGVLKGQPRKPERSRNVDLFAMQLTWSERYGVFEVDDGKGASARYEIDVLATNN